MKNLIRAKRKGQMVFTTPTALAFLIFILIYFPCIGVVVAIKNESGSWKWAVFAIFYTTALAWIAAFLYKCRCAVYVAKQLLIAACLYEVFIGGFKN